MQVKKGEKGTLVSFLVQLSLIYMSFIAMTKERGQSHFSGLKDETNGLMEKGKSAFSRLIGTICT